MAPRVTEYVPKPLSVDGVVLVWPVPVDDVVDVEFVCARPTTHRFREAMASNAVNLILIVYSIYGLDDLQLLPWGRQ
ncbi:MAG TPA: hypothetical protein VFN53_00200 [Acidobacteriaceae bacterium]|nr:hypothetical protein [Acidobacteriaceae bacterium]